MMSKEIWKRKDEAIVRLAEKIPNSRPDVCSPRSKTFDVTIACFDMILRFLLHLTVPFLENRHTGHLHINYLGSLPRFLGECSA